jgi:hypothetical protein
MWKCSSSRAERFPKIFFALSQCRITEDEVPETCSLDRRCTPTNGAKQRTRRRSRHVEACCASSLFFLAPTCIYKKEPLGFWRPKNQVGYEFLNFRA